MQSEVSQVPEGFGDWKVTLAGGRHILVVTDSPEEAMMVALSMELEPVMVEFVRYDES